MVPVDRYLFTNGGAALLSRGNGSLVTEGLPFLSGVAAATTVRLAMPHLVDTAPGTIAQPPPPHEPVLDVRAAAKLSEVYYDKCRLQIAFSVFPNTRPAHDPSQPTVLVTPNGEYSVCATFDPATGVGLCDMSGPPCLAALPFASFEETVAVTVRFADGPSGIHRTSNTVSLALKPIPANSAPTAAAVVARTPRYRVIREGFGATPFRVDLYASTGGEILDEVAVEFVLDPGVGRLSYRDTHASLLFRPTGEDLATPDRVVVTLSRGPAPGAPPVGDANFTGSGIHLGAVNFDVLPGAATEFAPIASVAVLSMRNKASVVFVANQGAVVDHVGASGTVGGPVQAVLQGDPEPILLQGTASPKYAILKPDRSFVAVSVTATVVNSGYNTPETVVAAASATCSMYNGEMSKTTAPPTDCVSFIPKGPAAATTDFGVGPVYPPGLSYYPWGTVTVTHGALTDHVPVQTFVATHATVAVDEPVINSTCSGTFGHTRVRKYTSFVDGRGVASEDVEVPLPRQTAPPPPTSRAAC